MPPLRGQLDDLAERRRSAAGRATTCLQPRQLALHRDNLLCNRIVRIRRQTQHQVTSRGATHTDGNGPYRNFSASSVLFAWVNGLRPYKELLSSITTGFILHAYWGRAATILVSWGATNGRLLNIRDVVGTTRPRGRQAFKYSFINRYA